MLDKDTFRKKYLFPIVYCGVIAMALWSGTSMIKSFAPDAGRFAGFSSIEPAAGDESMPKVNESELVSAQELDGLPTDAKEEAPLRISPDKPEVIHLDRDAINVLVGSEETLRAVPDTNRTIVLIPKKPGATYFKAMDADGKIIMQRHVIVGAPDKANKYIRIRRACAADDKNCKQFSVYYCPDICHEVNVVQGDKAAEQTNAPEIAPSVSDTGDGSEYVEPPTPNPEPTK